MTRDNDISRELAEAVTAAAAKRTPLAIRGGGTKRFYTGEIEGRPLDVTGHRGVVSYEPTELVITARAGTPLAEVEATLAEKGQMLGFEPPHFGAAATLGGAIACGFSGPRRPYAGAARDFVLGATIVNGKGEIVRFGGQVMKNVAGYDISRLMVGAFGTLGVLLDVSLKVLPKPARELTLAFEMPADKAIVTMNTWAGRPLPLSGACHLGDTLYMRLSGSASGVHAARSRLGGETVEKSEEFWRGLREQERGFFMDATPLWRLSVPPAAAPIELPGQWCLDWGGAQRWLKSAAPAGDIRRAAENAGGYAALFRGAETSAGSRFVLAPGLVTLMRQIKQAFDPSAVLNPVGASMLPG
jgi:glycolate oxidase FAD binding subunit